MKIIEFLGMPRSGKSTILSSLDTELNITSHFERFDLIPKRYNDPSQYNYNRWYAKYCIKKIRDLNKADSCTHVIERSLLDRIAFGKALAKYGKFSDKQLESYLKFFEPYINQITLGFVFHITPHNSLRNIRSQKQHITREPLFLELLYNEYENLRSDFSNLIFLKDVSDLSETRNFIGNLIVERFQT
jgi:hypothetical protein